MVNALLPTPTVQNSHGNTANNRGDLLLPGIVRLLPTPMAADGGAGRGSTAGFGLRNTSRNIAQDWGPFGLAIARLESAIGRPAPDPTEPGRRGGRPRLAVRFVEWLMGYTDGFLSDLVVRDTDPRPLRPFRISRNQALARAGNGIVALQGAHAIHLLISLYLLAKDS